MRPLVVTNAFRRPRGTRLPTGVKVSHDTNVYACVEEMIDVIYHHLDASPIMLPTLHDKATVQKLLDHADGIFLPGAHSNIHPSNYDEAPSDAPQTFDPAHDATDLFLIAEAKKRNLPFLGICRAMQAMNLVFKGTLHQDLKSKTETDHLCSVPCDGQKDQTPYVHKLVVSKDGTLHKILGNVEPIVNSMHEQAIAKPGKELIVEATAEDGVIEAISWPGATGFFMGVQWHPEAMPKHPVSVKIFSAFKAAIKQHHEKR